MWASGTDTEDQGREEKLKRCVHRGGWRERRYTVPCQNTSVAGNEDSLLTPT